MHQNDDNYYNWVKGYNLLSETEQNEKVYREQFTPTEPDSQHGSVECVDEFIIRMFKTYRPYEEDTWLVGDEDMFTERGMSYNGYEEWNFDGYFIRRGL